MWNSMLALESLLQEKILEIPNLQNMYTKGHWISLVEIRLLNDNIYIMEII